MQVVTDKIGIVRPNKSPEIEIPQPKALSKYSTSVQHNIVWMLPNEGVISDQVFELKLREIFDRVVQSLVDVTVTDNYVRVVPLTDVNIQFLEHYITELSQEPDIDSFELKAVLAIRLLTVYSFRTNSYRLRLSALNCLIHRHPSIDDAICEFIILNRTKIDPQENKIFVAFTSLPTFTKYLTQLIFMPAGYYRHITKTIERHLVLDFAFCAFNLIPTAQEHGDIGPFIHFALGLLEKDDTEDTAFRNFNTISLMLFKFYYNVLSFDDFMKLVTFKLSQNGCNIFDLFNIFRHYVNKFRLDSSAVHAINGTPLFLIPTIKPSLFTQSLISRDNYNKHFFNFFETQQGDARRLKVPTNSNTFPGSCLLSISTTSDS